MTVAYKVGDTIRYRLLGTTRICVVLWKGEIKDGRRGFKGRELDEDGEEVPMLTMALNDVVHDGCWGYDADVLEVLVGPT